MNASCNQHQALTRQWPLSRKKLIAYEIQALNAWIDRLICRTRNLFKLWRQRSRERQLLARMTAHQARDIGLSLSDLRREANKEFWQA